VLYKWCYIKVALKDEENMPPKQIVTREMIVEAAFLLVREGGMSALSARNIARSLNCSTQPIYSCFATMAEIETVVVRKAFEFIQSEYLVSKTGQDNNFMSIGLGYIVMARKEKHLFDLLYVSGRVRLDFEKHVFPVNTGALISVMRRDPWLTNLSDTDLLELLQHMWIYTHGLTMLSRTNPSVSDAFIEKSLADMGRLVVMNKLLEKGVVTHENLCDQRQSQGRTQYHDSPHPLPHEGTSGS
jgi:AcrR family transcriptional regulator